MISARAKYGFTLIEALVAVAILAIGVVGTLHGYQSLSRIETKAQSSEYMQRLAYEKYDEEVATTSVPISATNGDFSDRNITGYSWNMTVDSTSVTDLMAITVTVTKDSTGNTPTSPRGVARGLFYQSPNSGAAQ